MAHRKVGWINRAISLFKTGSTNPRPLEKVVGEGPLTTGVGNSPVHLGKKEKFKNHNFPWSGIDRFLPWETGPPPKGFGKLDPRIFLKISFKKGGRGCFKKSNIKGPWFFPFGFVWDGFLGVRVDTKGGVGVPGAH